MGEISDGVSEYARKRVDLRYYQVIRRWIESFGDSGTIVDVGNAGTSVVEFGTFARRIVVDLRPMPDRPGIEQVTGDFATVDLPVTRADVVTCCQVIEHLRDDQIRPFVDRLFSLGRRVIITLPFRWPAGTCQSHKQDPIDLAKFLAIVGREPKKFELVRDGRVRRIVSLFDRESLTVRQISLPPQSP